MNIDQIIATLIKLEADAAQHGFYSADFVSVVSALQLLEFDYDEACYLALSKDAKLPYDEVMDAMINRRERLEKMSPNLCGDPV